MSKRTFRYEAAGLEQLSASDLQEEAQNFPHAQAFRVTIFRDESYEHPEVAKADALYLPEEGRMGIAWGADATWADVDDVESGIEMWLNDGETWEQWN
jgi:hypothetical protein